MLGNVRLNELGACAGDGRQEPEARRSQGSGIHDGIPVGLIKSPSVCVGEHDPASEVEGRGAWCDDKGWK